MSYKKILSIVGVILFLMATAINTNISLNSQKKSSYRYGNVLALASGEIEDCTGIYKKKNADENFQKCTLYKQVHISGTIEYTETNKSLGTGWTVIQVQGLYNLCEKDKPNNCCEAFSCHVTNNTNPS